MIKSNREGYLGKCVIVTFGHSATGKTTISRILSKKLECPVVHYDESRHTVQLPTLLDDDDGLWDEFHYITGRDFPAVFAGHNEWESYGLQPIHFFAGGIPNGEYEVWLTYTLVGRLLITMVSLKPKR